MPNTQTFEELKEEFYEGGNEVGSPSDSMSFHQYLIRKGRADLIDLIKSGGLVTKPKGYKKGGSVSKKKKGGKARGCGVARKGTRKAKLY